MKYPEYHIIIPARINSERLPQKLLLDIDGLPVVIRTAMQAQKSHAKSVTVATDSQIIKNMCSSHKINAVITDVNHQTGTDRIAQAVSILNYKENEIIINVQGDEPLIDHKIIDDLAKFIVLQKVPVATIAHKIYTKNEIFNHNIVKVVLDKFNNALYFSRSPIPYHRDEFESKESFTLKNGINFLRHIGMYAYTVEFLKNYSKIPASLIEEIEKLEQLRILYNGYKLAVLVSNAIPEGGIDTIEDLKRVRQVVENFKISEKKGK